MLTEQERVNLQIHLDAHRESAQLLLVEIEKSYKDANALRSRVEALEAELRSIRNDNHALRVERDQARKISAFKNAKIGRLEAFVRGVEEYIIKAYDIDCPPTEYVKLLVDAMKED